MLHSCPTQILVVSKPSVSPSSPSPGIEQLQQEISKMTKQLSVTTSTLSQFAQSLEISQFKAYVDYLSRPWYRFWTNFLFGIVYGLGFAIGASVLLAVIVWIVSRILTQLPFVGEFFQTIQEFFTEENLKNIQSGNMLDTVSRMFDAFKANIIQGLQSGNIQNP